MISRWIRILAVTSAFALVLAGCGGGDDAAADYPTDSIEVIVPFPAGGGADSAIRTMQRVLEGELGQSLVILNQEGGGGTVGASEGAAAEGDGYTWLVMTVGPASTQPHLQDVPYDPDSFKPVTLLNNEPLIVTVPADSPFQTMDDLIAAAEGGDLTWAAPPVGGVPHLTGELILAEVGGSARMVPFDGTGPATTALLGNQIDVATLPTGTASSHIQEGTLRALGVTSAEPLPALSDIPTLVEQGIDVEVANWNGIVVPAETPDEVVEVIAAALQTGVESDEYQTFMDGLGSPLSYVPPEDFASLWETDFERFGELIDQLRADGTLE